MQQNWGMAWLTTALGCLGAVSVMRTRQRLAVHGLSMKQGIRTIYLLYGQNGGRTSGEPYSSNDCAWTRLSIKPGIKKISRQTGPHCFS